jgi:hypothetical protein
MVGFLDGVPLPLDKTGGIHKLRLELNAPFSSVPPSMARPDGAWNRVDETLMGNNIYELSVQFCDLKPDITAGEAVILGSKRAIWGTQVGAIIFKNASVSAYVPP